MYASLSSVLQIFRLVNCNIYSIQISNITEHIEDIDYKYNDTIISSFRFHLDGINYRHLSPSHRLFLNKQATIHQLYTSVLHYILWWRRLSKATDSKCQFHRIVENDACRINRTGRCSFAIHIIKLDTEIILIGFQMSPNQFRVVYSYRCSLLRL